MQARHRRKRRRFGWRQLYWLLALPAIGVPWYAVPLAEWLGINIWVETALLVLVMAALLALIHFGPAPDERD